MCVLCLCAILFAPGILFKKEKRRNLHRSETSVPGQMSSTSRPGFGLLLRETRPHRQRVYIQIWQHGAAAPTLTHQETGPAKSVSKQNHIGTAPVRCTAKFYRRPGKCTPGPCPGGSEAARQPGPWPGASPFIPPSIVTARGSVAWFTRNH